MEYTDLQIKILQYLRIHPSGATGKQLANHCKVSLNTIRREFIKLFDSSLEPFFELESRPSVGYRLIVKDAKATKDFFQQLNTKSNNPLFDNNQAVNYKKNYIIRKLLTKNDYVPILNIADELNYSESSVRRDLKLVEEYLRPFNLELKQKKNYGLYISGDELNKRICLISQHKYFVNLSKTQQNLEPDYRVTFSIGNPEIRTCVKKIQKLLIGNERCTYQLTDFPIVYNYIPIIRSRNKFTEQIALDERKKEFLEHSGLIELSRDLLMSISDTIKINEEEILVFAMVMEVYRTVVDISQLTDIEKEIMYQYTKELLSYVDETIFISDYISKKELDEFSCILYGVLNKILFKIIPDKEHYRTLREINPFVEDLCLSALEYLERKCETKIPKEIGAAFYYFFLKIYLRKVHGISHLRIGLLSTYGIQYANYCKENILKEYHDYIYEIDTVEFSQMNDAHLKNYDYIVSDVRVEMLPRECKEKYCFLEVQNEKNHRVKGLEDIIEMTVENAKNEMMIFEQTKGKTLLEVIHTIAAYFKEEGIEEKLLRRIDFNCQQDHEYTIYLSAQSHTIKTGLYFFELEQELKWEGKKINQIVCAIYDSKQYIDINIMQKMIQN